MARLWTIKDAARHWDVSYDTVRKWISRGHVRSAKFGRAHRIPQAEVDRVDERIRTDGSTAA